MALSPEELERYARHIVVPEVGGPGQAKLINAKVLVIGAGGLGAPALVRLLQCPERLLGFFGPAQLLAVVGGFLAGAAFVGLDRCDDLGRDSSRDGVRVGRLRV